MGIKILRQGLPVIGHAKIGEPGVPKPGKKMAPPTKFDHLELTTVERNEHGQLYPDVDLMLQLIDAGARTCGGCARSQQLAKVFGIEAFEGGLPTELAIMLPFDDPDVAFPNKLAWHRGRLEFCSGDGESAMRRTVEGKDASGAPVFGPAQPHGPCGRECPDFLERCKPKARLRFVLGHQANVGGCYEFRTTSWNSIANISQSLDLIRSATGGTLGWIPLILDTVRQTVQPRGGPPNTAWIARVYFDGSPMDLLARVRDNLQLRAPMMADIKRLEADLRQGTWEMTADEVDDFRHEFDAHAVAEEQGRTLEPSAEPVAAPPPAPTPAEPSDPDPGAEPEPPADPAPPQSEDSAAPSDSAPGEPIFVGPRELGELWGTCKTTAQKIRRDTGKQYPGIETSVLRHALRSVGVEKSEKILESRYHEALRAAEECTPSDLEQGS